MTCDGTVMNIEIEVFSPRSTAAPVNAERRHQTRITDADDISEAPLTTRAGAPLPGWRLIRANDPAFTAAAGLWIDGEPTTPGVTMRLRMARTSVTGGSYAPVLIIITPVADWAHVDTRQRQDLEYRIAAVLEAHPEIGDQVRAIAEAAQ
jgi:hypothetical protein